MECCCCGSRAGSFELSELILSHRGDSRFSFIALGPSVHIGNIKSDGKILGCVQTSLVIHTISFLILGKDKHLPFHKEITLK